MEIKESLAYKMQLERSWPFAPSKEAIAESASGQAVCMKLAYDICLEEPELTGELKAYLENMEPEYYTVAVQCVRNNILKKIR